MQIDLNPTEAVKLLTDMCYPLENALERLQEEVSPKDIHNALHRIQKMKALLRGIETYLNGIPKEDK
jgi:hypothetical protein